METATLYKKVIERVKPKTEDEAADIYADIYAMLKGNGRSKPEVGVDRTTPPHTEAALKGVRPEIARPEKVEPTKVAQPEVKKEETPEVKEPEKMEAKTIFYADRKRGVKICPKCKEERDLEKDFYSYKDSKGKLKYAGYCKECDKNRQRERKKKNDFADDYSAETPTVDGKRVCSDCRTPKLLSDFYAREREGKPTLYSCYCKECARKRTKHNKEKARAAKAASALRERNETVGNGIVDYADGVNTKIRNSIRSMYWAKKMTVEEISFSLGGMNVERIKKVLFSSGG